MGITEEEPYRALSISEDDNFELHLIRLPNSCFENNYLGYGLPAWRANLDIQPVFNEYRAVTYMISYFSKTKDQCFQAMKVAAKGAFKQNFDHFEAIKSIIKAYICRGECSVQEVVLPELKLRRVFPAVYSVNINLPKQKTKVVLNEKDLNELPDEGTYIFKRRNTNRYIDRPNAQFCNGSYNILDTFLSFRKI